MALIKNRTDKLTDDITSKEMRLVLLGKTGAGKSTTGCSILGGDYEAFQISDSPASCTAVCQHKETERFGKKVRIVDTPGLMDTDRSKDDIRNEVIKCVVNSAPGVHAFLVVLRADVRFSPEEKAALNLIQSYFGNDIYKYIILVFTYSGKCNTKEKLRERLAKMPDPFPEIYQKCGQRAIAFPFEDGDEPDERERQVKKLMDLVAYLQESNGGKFYTDKNLQEAETKMRVEAEKKRIEIERKFQEVVDRLQKAKEEEALQEVQRRQEEEERRAIQEERERLRKQAEKNPSLCVIL